MMASHFAIALVLLTSTASAAKPMDVYALRESVLKSEVVQTKIAKTCQKHAKWKQCETEAADKLFCQLLERSNPDMAAEHCAVKAKAAKPVFLQVASQRAPEDELAKEMTHDLEMNFNKIAPFGKEDTAKELQDHAAKTQDTLVDAVENAEVAEIKRAVFRALTRLRAATIKEFDTIARLETQAIDAYNDAHHYRAENPLAHLHEDEAPVETDKLKSFHFFLQTGSKRAPEDELAKEMTHDLEMNFNKIAPFGKEDTAKELQDHAAKTQDTLVDAVENAEVAEIKRAVFRALTRLRAATIKEFDTIARLETQAIDAYNDAHHYRAENPLAHLHEDEAPVETDKLKSFH